MGVFDDLVPQGEKQGSGAFDDLAPQHAPVQAGRWSTKLGRLAQGAMEPVIGAGQLAAHLTGVGGQYMDRKAQEAADLYQASRREAGLKPEDWDYWAGAGNVAATAAPGVGWGLRGAKAAAAAPSFLGLAGRGAASGAAAGAAQPVSDITPQNDYGSQKEAQIASGALTGAVASPIASKAAGALAPRLSPEAVMISQEGGDISPGRLAGGMWRKGEDVVTRTPILGEMLGEPMEQNLEAFNRAAANRALRPLGKELPENVKAGNEAAKFVRKEMSDAFADAHKGMRGILDGQLTADVRSIVDDAAMSGELPDIRVAQLEKIINAKLVEKMNATGGAMNGSQIQSMRSSLRETIRKWEKSQDEEYRYMAYKLSDLNDSIGAMLERHNPQEMVDKLRTVDFAYKSYVQLRNASAGATTFNREGVFTPHKYAEAVAKSARNKGETSEGQALNQDLAIAGKKLIPAIPNSGTPERQMWNGIVLGGAGAAAHSAIGPQAAITIPTLLAMYSKPGVRALNRYARNQPQSLGAIRDALDRYGSAVAPSIAPALGTQGSSTQEPPYVRAGERFTNAALAADRTKRGQVNSILERYQGQGRP